MEASAIGLVFLMAAWLIQMLHALWGEREIQKPFLITYAIGSIILVLDGLDAGGFSTQGWLNLIIFAFLLVILLKNPKH